MEKESNNIWEISLRTHLRAILFAPVVYLVSFFLISAGCNDGFLIGGCALLKAVLIFYFILSFIFLLSLQVFLEKSIA